MTSAPDSLPRQLPPGGLGDGGSEITRPWPQDLAEAMRLAPPGVREVMRRLTDAVLSAHRSTLALASAMAEAERRGVAQACGWPDLETLAAAVWGYRRRKTRQLIAIHRVWIERWAYGEELADVHWTKLAELLPVASASNDRAEVEAWLARARAIPLRILRAEVRAWRTGLPSEARVSKTFALPAGAERVLELALDAIGREAGTDDRGRQLELLAADALAGRLGGGQAYGVTLIVTMQREAWDVVRQALDASGIRDRGEALRLLAEHWLGCRWARRYLRETPP